MSNKKVIGRHFATLVLNNSKIVLHTQTQVQIISLLHKLTMWLSRKIRKIGYYLNPPPFRNGSIDQLHLRTQPLIFISASTANSRSFKKYPAVIVWNRKIDWNLCDMSHLDQFEMIIWNPLNFSLSFSLLIKARITSFNS